jgi:protein-tyrosine phosphatase
MRAFWVSERLGFGSAVSSWQDVRRLHEMGFTHVVNLRHCRGYRKKLRSFHRLWLPFPDDMEPRPAWFYRDALRFYKRAMERPNSKLYVMCHHGICRSASMTYFFLRLDGFSPARAKSTVLKARRCARVVPAYQRSGEDFRSLYKMRQINKGKHTKS